MKGGERSKEILCAWTGWPLLPDGPLILKVEDDVDFVVHACTSEMILPSTWHDEDVRINLKLLLEYGSTGFGVV